MSDGPLKNKYAMQLEARITVIEHLIVMLVAADIHSSFDDPEAAAKDFVSRLRQNLETPPESDLPPELSALVFGEIGDQAHRLGEAILEMIRSRLDKS